MKKKFILLCICIALFSSCKEKDTTFLITNESIGKLDKISLARDLELIYADDSIVKDTFNSKLGPAYQKVKIFEKGGKHLLTLTPSEDSIPVIENIRVFDPRFTAENGIGLNSTFKDIQDNYTIKKIITTLNSVVIFVKETDMYFTIDKQELPANLRFGVNTIEEVQIPGDAEVKYLMIGWN
ncbi:hypothetical protein [uncultured Croceitalea sp.]|uniref:hypothetical protein n=1 Tax=uncultured Croceitalea sp. TaxID=1798908 RepID=UPI00330623C8